MPFLGLGESRADIGQVLQVITRNALVLALHAMACVAGFIAGSSLPLEAQQRSGAWRWIHEKAGPLAILFVIAATAFSLMTQAIVLGAGAASLSAKLAIGPGLLLLGLLPHALPELVALFLPLAAWMIASRQNDWHQLLAATVVTVLLAVPVIVASAFVEVYFSPGLLWIAATNQGDHLWPVRSSKSQTTASRPRSWSPRPPSSSTSGRPGAVPAARSLPCSRRSPKAVMTCASSSSTSTRTR
jgi:hypothetical protein